MSAIKRLRNTIVLLCAALVLLGVLLTAVLRAPVKEKEEVAQTGGIGSVSDSGQSSSGNPDPEQDPQEDEELTVGEEGTTEDPQADSGEETSDEASGETTGGEEDPEEDPQTPVQTDDEFLMLVNADNPMPEGYVPQVTKIYGGDYKFDSRVVDKLNLMMGEAYEQGITLWPLSAYRSVESQTRNFNNKLAENKAAGYSDEEAFAMTARYIAIPGTSEHSIGLAVDLNSLEESFDKTPAFAWLMENCANYGFILRYPEGKEDITGIAYEPWHYRYVGEEHAKKIMEQGITLEEYLQ